MCPTWWFPFRTVSDSCLNFISIHALNIHFQLLACITKQKMAYLWGNPGTHMQQMNALVGNVCQLWSLRTAKPDSWCRKVISIKNGYFFFQKPSIQRLVKPWTWTMFFIWIVLPQCNLMYGWKLYSYHTLLHAAKTIVSLQLGIFNYEEVWEIITNMFVHNDQSQWLNLTLLLPQKTGFELQSCSWCIHHWFMHHLHDICGSEPIYIGNPGGIFWRTVTP